MTIPVESIPDGAVFAPHHFHYAVLAALLVAAVVWDNYREREPVLLVAGLFTAEFGFTLTWPHYPVTGAALAVGGTLAATVPLAHALGVVVGRRLGREWSRPYWAEFPLLAVVVFALLLVAWDDLLNHAFGLSTPLDSIWKHHIYSHVP